MRNLSINVEINMFGFACFAFTFLKQMNRFYCHLHNKQNAIHFCYIHWKQNTNTNHYHKSIGMYRALHQSIILAASQQALVYMTSAIHTVCKISRFIMYRS